MIFSSLYYVSYNQSCRCRCWYTLPFLSSSWLCLLFVLPSKAGLWQCPSYPNLWHPVCSWNQLGLVLVWLRPFSGSSVCVSSHAGSRQYSLGTTCTSAEGSWATHFACSLEGMGVSSSRVLWSVYERSFGLRQWLDHGKQGVTPAILLEKATPGTRVGGGASGYLSWPWTFRDNNAATNDNQWVLRFWVTCVEPDLCWLGEISVHRCVSSFFRWLTVFRPRRWFPVKHTTASLSAGSDDDEKWVMSSTLSVVSWGGKLKFLSGYSASRHDSTDDSGASCSVRPQSPPFDRQIFFRQQSWWRVGNILCGLRKQQLKRIVYHRHNRRENSSGDEYKFPTRPNTIPQLKHLFANVSSLHQLPRLPHLLTDVSFSGSDHHEEWVTFFIVSMNGDSSTLFVTDLTCVKAAVATSIKSRWDPAQLIGSFAQGNFSFSFLHRWGHSAWRPMVCPTLMVILFRLPLSSTPNWSTLGLTLPTWWVLLMMRRSCAPGHKAAYSLGSTGIYLILVPVSLLQPWMPYLRWLNGGIYWMRYYLWLCTRWNCYKLQQIWILERCQPGKLYNYCWPLADIVSLSSGSNNPIAPSFPDRTETLAWYVWSHLQCLPLIHVPSIIDNGQALNGLFLNSEYHQTVGTALAVCKALN